MSLTYKEIYAYRAENEDFFNALDNEDGVVKLNAGVKYKEIRKGSGKLPNTKSKVEVHYKGCLIDGKVFDSSYLRKKTESFRLNEVIKGWKDALLRMNEGSRWKIYISSDYGYGSQAIGNDIPAYSTLVFDVELIKIKR